MLSVNPPADIDHQCCLYSLLPLEQYMPTKMTIGHAYTIAVFRYGFYLAISLVAIFMLMKALVLNGSIAYRIIDIAIIYFFVGRSLHFYHLHSVDDGQRNFRKIGLGIITSFFGSFLFALFLLIYLSLMDEGYLNFLKETLPMGEYLNPFLIAFVVLIEGVAIGTLSAYIQAIFNKNSKS